MRQDRLVRSHTLDPAQNLRQMGVGDMRLAAHGGNHPGLDPFQGGEGRLRQGFHIGRIGKGAGADTDRAADDMVLFEQGEIQRADLQFRRRIMHLQIWPYRENDAMGGHDPYSASKGCAELVTASFARTFFASSGSARVISVRAGNVIGGGDWAADRLIPDLVRAAVNEMEVQIRSPSSVRPWQHVMDPLLGYLLAIEHAMTRTKWSGFDCWNFGPNPGEELPVSDVVELFQAGWDGKPHVKFGKRDPGEHEAGLLRVDATKAKIELGWRPCTDNRGAVALAVEWFRLQREGGDARELTSRHIDLLTGAGSPAYA